MQIQRLDSSTHGDDFPLTSHQTCPHTHSIHGARSLPLICEMCVSSRFKRANTLQQLLTTWWITLFSSNERGISTQYSGTLGVTPSSPADHLAVSQLMLSQLVCMLFRGYYLHDDRLCDYHSPYTTAVTYTNYWTSQAGPHTPTGQL